MTGEQDFQTRGRDSRSTLVPARPWARTLKHRLRGTPAVVFLDDGPWNAFFQLAAQLRHAGVRTIRLSTDTRAGSRLLSLLLFDAYRMLPDASDGRPLRQLLAAECPVDLQFVETLAPMVHESLDLLPPAAAEQVQRRIAVMDKFEASRVFVAAGIRAPSQASLAEVSAEEIALRFGYPIAVKARLGCGGTEVTIARDLEALIAAIHELAGEPERYFYQRFVDGDKFNYAAVVSADGIEEEFTYRVTHSTQPGGMATDIETINDPALLGFGRRVLDAAGCTGFVDLDVIRDASGQDWLIDFNARAFGGAANFLSAGVDTSQGYLKAIGLRTASPARTVPPPGVAIKVFPTCLEEVARSGSIAGTTYAFLRLSWPYLRWLGFRYWLSEALMMIYLVARSSRMGVWPRRDSPRTPSGR